MSRGFTIFYKIFSLLRFLAAMVVLIIIVVAVFNGPTTPARDKEPGWDFFTPLEELVLWSAIIAYPLNPIINFLIVFTPRRTLPGIFDWKPLFILMYVVEALMLPYFMYLAWEQVRDAFFRRRRIVILVC